MGSLEEGATNVVKTCMGVNNSDRIMIVTDRDTKEIADAIHTIAKSITDSRVFVLEDYASRPIKELPAEVNKAISTANVTFWIAQSFKGELEMRSFFRTTALKYARHAHMPGVTKTVMEHGMCVDYNLVYKKTMKVYEIIKNVSNIHVQSQDGTSVDLKFDKNWKWIPSHGIFHKKGDWGNLPDGEVFTTPNSVKGTIIVSELGDWFTKKYGYLNDKISLEIKNSRIDLDNIQCSDTLLKTELLQYLNTDENSNKASEFAIPTNFSLMNLPLIGSMLQDEKARVHIAFGDPYGTKTNANWKSRTHVDCILEKCDITADGKKIMKLGELFID